MPNGIVNCYIADEYLKFNHGNGLAVLIYSNKLSAKKDILQQLNSSTSVTGQWQYFPQNDSIGLSLEASYLKEGFAIIFTGNILQNLLEFGENEQYAFLISNKAFMNNYKSKTGFNYREYIAYGLMCNGVDDSIRRKIRISIDSILIQTIKGISPNIIKSAGNSQAQRNSYERSLLNIIKDMLNEYDIHYNTNKFAGVQIDEEASKAFIVFTYDSQWAFFESKRQSGELSQESISGYWKGLGLVFDRLRHIDKFGLFCRMHELYLMAKSKGVDIHKMRL